MKTPGLTTSRGTQYWMTSAAAVSWFGVTMMYLNQYLVFPSSAYRGYDKGVSWDDLQPTERESKRRVTKARSVASETS